MTSDLPWTILGRTNLEVTRFGIGGTYCETVDGYRAALDCGVNYIDTARSYLGGKDEKVIGQAIQGRRHELIVASKSAKRDAEGTRQELQTSLRARFGYWRQIRPKPAHSLSYAARNSHTQIVGKLLDLGADPAAPAESPWAQPLYWAEKEGHGKVAALLKEWSDGKGASDG